MARASAIGRPHPSPRVGKTKQSAEASKSRMSARDKESDSMELFLPVSHITGASSDRLLTPMVCRAKASTWRVILASVSCTQGGMYVRSRNVTLSCLLNARQYALSNKSQPLRYSHLKTDKNS